MIIAIDPGISTGWSIISEHAGLVACGIGEEWDLKIWGPVEWHAVIEMPRVYPRERVDPNDLMVLARRVGRYEERLLNLAAMSIETVFPRTWKGTLDKETHHARGRRKMQPNELRIVDEAVTGLSKKATLDVLDAVNLALWKVGRLPLQGQA